MYVRNNARAFVINDKNQILLQKFEFTFGEKSKVLWVTPGGGVEEGESLEQTLERELYEELGIRVAISNEPIVTLDIPFDSKSGRFLSHEVYYLIKHCDGTNISIENMTTDEKDTFREIGWFSFEQLEREEILFEPKTEILRILESIKR